MPDSLHDDNPSNEHFNDFLIGLRNKKQLTNGKFGTNRQDNFGNGKRTNCNNNKSQLNSNKSIGKNKDIPNVIDDYDSTGQNGKTDDSCNSSSQDDEDGLHHSKNKSKSKPVDIKIVKNRIRGILKYPPGWPRKAFSESDASMVNMLCQSDASSHSDFDYGYYGTSIESPEIPLDCFEFDDLNKPKKCVTFADKQSTYVFRPGSSILGRKQKNQKKAQKKKERQLKKLSEELPTTSSTNCNDGSLAKNKLNEIDDVKNAIDLQREFGINHFNDDTSCSSTDDALSSESCESSCNDTSASECSSADELSQMDQIEESRSDYIEELKNDNISSYKANNKSKRKNLRKRNRDKKFQRQIYLETGGYDSD